MNCQFDKELLALYSGGDVNADERLNVENHLQECPLCRRAMEEYREGQRALSRFHEAETFVRSNTRRKK